MKLFKKAAALFFCLALALSVMAISASAEDAVYTLSLGETPSITRVSSFGVTYTGGDPQNANGYYAVNKGDVITYDLMLASPNDTDHTSSVKINSLKFTLMPVNGYTIAVTLGKNGGSTVTANGNNVYAFNPTQTDNDIDSATGTDKVKVGTVSITVDNNATENVEQAFSLTNINLSERATVTNWVIASLDSAIKVIVNPQYNVSVDTKSVDETTGVITTESTFEVTNGVYKFSEGYALSDALLAAHTFGGWTVVAGSGGHATGTGGTYAAGGAWATSTNYPAGTTTLPKGMVGDVCLELQYSEISYTVTYKTPVDTNTPAVVTPTGDNAYVASYTISNLANSSIDYFKFFTTPPTRPGYAFDGWTVAATADSTNGAVNTAKWKNDNLTPTSTAAGLVGAYGDVTLTATWKIVGVYQFVDYAYAAGNDSLLLYAVPTATVTGASGSKYQCNNGDMIKIADSTDTDAIKAANFTKYTSAFASGKLESEVAYTLFGYFMNAGTESAPATPTFTLVTGTNEALAYNGDVDHDTSWTAADYGNVNSLLLQTVDETNGRVQFGGNYSQFSMLARLEADMSSASDTHYGSIDDVVEIIKTLTA